MEQMMLQTASLQTKPASQSGYSGDSQTVDDASSFESLLAEKCSGKKEPDSSQAGQESAPQKTEDPEDNTALLEQAAINLADSLAWGNLMVDLASLQQEKVLDVSQSVAINQLPAAEPVQIDVSAEVNGLSEDSPLATATVGEEVAFETVSQVKAEPVREDAPEPSPEFLESVPEKQVAPVEKGDEAGESLLEKSDTASQTDTSKTQFEVLDAEAAPQQPYFQTVEAMPVKVGDGAVLDTESPNFDVDLSQTIQKAANEGVQKVEIQLSPENLGNIVVEMTRDSNGLLHVTLHPESEHAARLLQGHADALSELLQGSSSQVHVEVSAPESQADSWQPPDQQHSGGQPREQRNHRQNTEDFLNQLRLGLLQTVQE